jgi:serine protease Do
VKVTLGRLAEQNVRKASADDRGEHNLGSLGLTLAPAAEVKGAGEKGLAIVGIDPDGKAAETGLQRGDVIEKAGSRDLTSPADLRAAMAEAKAAGRKHVLVRVSRDQTDRFVALPVG